MARVFVAGYGNPLRRDDGAGWRVAEAVADRWSGRVTVRTGQQLVPEWAADLADADVAFLVDASGANHGRVRLTRVVPTANESLLDGHTLGPNGLLRLVQVVYRRNPKAYLVHVPAEQFNFGDELSPRAAAGVQQAIQLIDRRLATLA